MSFWSEVEAAISAEAKIIEADVLKAMPFVKTLAVATAQELGKAALSAVVAAAPLLISGKEKLSTAIASVGQSLATSGKAAALSDIEIAVQAAYNQLGLSKPAGQ